jgi:ribose/xylose/arabinose/galactoside ABC-type transport system permease subunit
MTADPAERRRRLRQDRAANIGVMAGFIAALPASLAWMELLLPHNYAAAKTTPVYWLIVLPVVIWTVAASSFSPWALRLLRPVLLLAPLAAALALMIAFGRDDSPVPFLAAFAVSVMASLAGWLAYGRSLLAHGDAD